MIGKFYITSDIAYVGFILILNYFYIAFMIINYTLATAKAKVLFIAC